MRKNKYKIVYLHNKILFPHGTLQCHAYINEKLSLKAGETVLAYTIRNILDIYLPPKRLITVAKVTKEIESKKIPMVEIKGMARARLIDRDQKFFGSYEKIAPGSVANSHELADAIRKKAQEFVFLIDIPESDRLIYLMTFISELNELVDFISHYFITDIRKKWKLYKENNLKKKANNLHATLEKLIKSVRKKLDREERTQLV